MDSRYTDIITRDFLKSQGWVVDATHPCRLLLAHDRNDTGVCVVSTRIGIAPPEHACSTIIKEVLSAYNCLCCKGRNSHGTNGLPSATIAHLRERHEKYMNQLSMPHGVCTGCGAAFLNNDIIIMSLAQQFATHIRRKNCRHPVTGFKGQLAILEVNDAFKRDYTPFRNPLTSIASFAGEHRDDTVIRVLDAVVVTSPEHNGKKYAVRDQQMCGICHFSCEGGLDHDEEMGDLFDQASDQRFYGYVNGGIPQLFSSKAAAAMSVRVTMPNPSQIAILEFAQYKTVAGEV